MLVLVVLSLCEILFNSAQCSSTYDQRQTGDLNVQIDLKNLKIIALMKGGKEEYVDYDYAYDYSEMTIKPPNGTTPKPLNASTTVTIETNNTNNSTPSQSAMQTDVKKTTTNPEQTVTEPYLSQANKTETFLGQSYTNEAVESNVGLSNLSMVTKVTTERTVPGDTNQSHVTTNQLPPTLAGDKDQKNGQKLNISHVSTNHLAPTIVDVLGHTNASDQRIGETSASVPSPVNDTAQATKCRRGFVQNGSGKCEFKVHGTSNALRRIVNLAQKIKVGRKFTEVQED